MLTYFYLIFFLPIKIDEEKIPSLINGVTTSTSIAIGLGGVLTGFVFRHQAPKDDLKTKKIFYLFLVYLW